MKAIRIEKFGGPEVMSFKELPSVSQPQDGEILVRLEAIGVNFIDVYHRTGLYAVPLPFTLGSEGAGVVEKVGRSVTDLKSGDRVGFASVLGTYAEMAVIPAAKAVPLPESLGTVHAAAILLQGMTAHYLTQSTYRIQAGDIVLVHAAAGGVGLLLVQIAKHHGAIVIGTVSTAEKAKIAREAGADEVVLYTEKDFAPEVKRIGDGKGANVIYDSVGQNTFERSLDCLRPRGMMVSFGQSSGAVPPFNPLVLSSKGSLYLTRPSLGHYVLTREELLQRAAEVFEWIKNGVIRIRIDQTFSLQDAAEAHRRLESRASSGKIVLIP